jgi:hypothetical protein
VATTRAGGSTPVGIFHEGGRNVKVDRMLLKVVGLVLLVVAAILLFAETQASVAWGLGALGLACSVGGDIRG